MLDLSTARFRREYDEAFGGLTELIESTESTAIATVESVFVGDVDATTAEAITVVDAAVEGTAGQRSVADSYVRLDLVKVDEVWRVDGVTSLNFTAADGAVPGATPAPGGEGEE